MYLCFKFRKTCILAPLFLRAIMNMFIQVNIITYLDRNFKKDQNQEVGILEAILTIILYF